MRQEGGAKEEGPSRIEQPYSMKKWWEKEVEGGVGGGRMTS